MKNCVCEICGRKYVFNRPSGYTLTKCNSCMANRRRFKIKYDAVKYRGGKCSKCGYDKCIMALSFHHRDKASKEFNISGSHTRKWSVLKDELDKCDILCENCHRELHWEEYSRTHKVKEYLDNLDK